MLKVREAVQNVAVSGSNAFSKDLYGVLPHSGNAFSSPYNVHSVLSMALPGARGNTAKQMADVLHCDGNEDSLHHDYADLLERLKPFVKVASMLWGQEGYPFDPAFVSVVEEFYGAGMTELDFGRSTDAAEEINRWASDHTGGKIKGLVSKDLLGELTRLVLTGAVYFKGEWETAFDRKSTRKGTFHGSLDSSSEASFMALKNHFAYGENDDVQVLEMPYKGAKNRSEQMVMTIILPKTTSGICHPETEAFLSKEKLDSILRGSREVAVRMPKFKVESRFLLRPALEDLGMEEAFSPNKADFSGMTTTTNPDEELHVSEVVHKAYVAVDEEGTEAAAATAMICKCRGMSMVTSFVADHPFLFLIRHKGTGLTLFVGRVEKPEE
jgi:serpin B